MQKYSKQDEKLVKDLLENLYVQHQKIHGGSLTGGSFFTDFVHGFTVPFKQLGSVFDLFKPGAGDVVRNVAESVDKLVPGKRYASIEDVFNNKPIAGTGTGGGKCKVGRPRKIKVEVSVMPVKRRGRPRKA